MMRSPVHRSWVVAAAALVALATVVGEGRVLGVGLPSRLSDRDFWQLSQELSEQDGSFQSDNLVSNETGFQAVIPSLVERLGTGGVYLGVGPEQNFTYIAALEPKIAFIVDIRTGNRNLHLMYKALFEMADDRAQFVSLLFSRPRPAGLKKDATAVELFAAFADVPPSETLYDKHLTEIKTTLVRKHRLPLSDSDLGGIEYAYHFFRTFGPGIAYISSRTGRSGTGATYAMLMQTTDGRGVARSYLATEKNFQVVKRLHTANLLVPVVGNFSGPKAVRAVGAWLRDRGAIVSAYYLSNVEDYLNRDGTWLDFCRNVDTLPLGDTSTFIRTGRGYQPRDLQAVEPVVLPNGVRRLVMRGFGENPVVQGPSIPAGSRLGLIRDDLEPCMPAAAGQN